MIAEQSEKMIESLEATTKSRFQTPRKSGTKSPISESIESNKFVAVPGTYQGIYMTRLLMKPEDKGKQELSMPFLSNSTKHWISSLRTQIKSSIRPEKLK